jgi:acyl carrier protein
MTRNLPTGFLARARSRAMSRRLAVAFFSALPFALTATSAEPARSEANRSHPLPCTKASRSEIKKRLEKITVEHLDVGKSKFTDKARFIEDLGADSLDMVELVIALEEEFNCEIPDAAAEKIVTVKDAVEFLVKSSVCSKQDIK